MNIEIDIPRGYLASPNLNNSREIFVSSTMSFIDYVDWVQA